MSKKNKNDHANGSLKKQTLFANLAQNLTTDYLCIDMDVLGNYTTYLQANGTETKKTFDAVGFPVSSIADNHQNLSYDFNWQTGNLLKRTENLGSEAGLIENFTYDAANDNRLATSQVVANGIPQPTITTQYAANGNISQKTDVGTYAYDAQKINAVTAITNQQSVGLNNQTVKYTAFLMPDTIKTGNMLAAITYGGDHQRRKMVVSTDCVGSPAPCTAGATLTRYYFGNYEVTIDHTQNDKQFETHTPNPRRG